MSKEKKPSKIPVFTDRFNKFFYETDYNTQEFANNAGITRQALNSYLNENRVPDSEALRKICSAYHISADYLLGLSKAQKPDPTLRAACEYTGLSEKEIEMISHLKERYASAVTYFLTADPIILSYLFGKIEAYLSGNPTVYVNNAGSAEIPKDLAKQLAKYYAVQHFEALLPDE